MLDHVSAPAAVVALVACLGCPPAMSVLAPVQTAQATGGTESPLELTVDYPKPLVVENWATVTLRLTNRSDGPVTVWLRTWDDGHESLPICEEYRDTHFDMTSGAIPGGANKGWTTRTLAPSESLEQKPSFHVQLFYEGDHEVVFSYDPLSLENVAQEVRDAQPATARSEPVPFRVANGNRIPVYEGNCHGVPELHPELTDIPEILRKTTSLLLLDWTPRDLSGLDEWAQRAAGVRLVSMASEDRAVVWQGQIGMAYGVFVTCDVRSAPMYRALDVLASLWNPAVRWRFEDGVVTFYDEVEEDHAPSVP